MSDKVIQFTKVKIPMIILSLLVIAGGFTGIAFNRGFNLGIDFMSGINMRLQIAEKVFKVSYTGSDRAVLNIREGILEIDLIREGGLVKDEKIFALSDYATVADLVSAVSGAAAESGVVIEILGDTGRPAVSLIGLNYAAELNTDGMIINSVNIDQGSYIGIADVRNALSSLGAVQIQTAGKAANQEFIVRLQDKGDSGKDFSVKASGSILKLLEDKYGRSNVIIKQTDYVGPRFSQNMGYQSVTLTGFALLLILVYIWFRFKLEYAVSAVVALLHDVLVMIGVIGAFRIEVNTATIAAVLTIIGYSLNDTIVIFDRIRENQNLLREKDFVRIINISISQSLSRTLITSLTTLLAVAAIYFFGSGMIKIFALNLIVGVTVGTYSSIFIASPVLLGWVNIVKKRSVDAAEKKYNDKQIPAEEKAVSESVSEDIAEASKKELKISAPVISKRQMKKRTVKK